MSVARNPKYDPFIEYLGAIEGKFKTKKATEHTYRGILETYVSSFESRIHAVNEPKRVTCVAPDFIVTRGKIPLGYIEAKNIGESLDKCEKSNQLKRYFSSLGNLLLTDYLEFRWYVNGEKRLTVRLA